MTEIDDATIEKIANAVKNKRISDRWQDPKTAERWGSAGGNVALIVGVITVLAVALTSMYADLDTKYEDGNEIYQKISLTNMDCKTLKKTLIDLEASESDYVPSLSVEKQIIARCK